MKVLVHGRACGTVLKSSTPINFLGTVDKKTGIVREEGRDLHEKPLGGTILVFPSSVGSSVGAYTIYSIKSNSVAPLAMICQKADLTVTTGCAVADIPLVIVNEKEFASISNGTTISLDTSIGLIQ